MQDGGMVPDFSLLLDLCGWTGPQRGAETEHESQPAVVRAASPDRPGAGVAGHEL
jgi:hypothetical protein